MEEDEDGGRGDFVIELLLLPIPASGQPKEHNLEIADLGGCKLSAQVVEGQQEAVEESCSLVQQTQLSA
eukprot:3261216-Rhodomonas_salina.1